MLVKTISRLQQCCKQNTWEENNIQIGFVHWIEFLKILKKPRIFPLFTCKKEVSQQRNAYKIWVLKCQDGN